jgi:hypothetical protein
MLSLPTRIMGAGVMRAPTEVSRRSTYFFAMPSWLDGPARLFNFLGGHDRYNWGTSREEGDTFALAMDWYAVGDDIVAATDWLASQPHNLRR